MPNWTDKHNAHIARECEGLQVTQSESGKWVYYQPPSKHATASWLPVPSYNHNAGLRDRAAEAWRKKEPGRRYESHSKVEDEWGLRETWATCFSSACCIAGSGHGEHALLWALYRATKKDGK